MSVDTTVTTDTAVTTTATVTVEDTETTDTAVTTTAIETTDTAVTTVTVDATDLVAELEKDVVDLTFEEFGKRLKKIDNDGILRMTQNVQGNTWDNMTDPRIKRMRMIMEIKAAYYPDDVKKSVGGDKKAKSPWKPLTLENLIDAAKKHNLTYKDCDSESIKRMRIIMELKKAGITAESLSKFISNNLMK